MDIYLGVLETVFDPIFYSDIRVEEENERCLGCSPR
jgi:hypothetical protein